MTKYKRVLLTVSLLGSISTLAVEASGGAHSLMAHVCFYATSTSVHTGVGTSQDVYLAEVTPRRTREMILARLIDEYPSYRIALSSEIVKSSEGATLNISRDPACDIALSLMPLRTAPGDPMAILPERLGFEPQLLNPVRDDDVLPCYKIVR